MFLILRKAFLVIKNNNIKWGVMNIKNLFDKEIIDILKKENKYLNLIKKDNRKLNYIKNIIFKPKYKKDKIYNLILKDYYIETGRYKKLNYNQIEESINCFLYNLNKKELDKLINNRIIINPKKIKIKILKNFIKEEKDFIKNNIEIACDFVDTIWTYYSVDQEKYKKEVSEINQIKVKLLIMKEKD